MSAYICICTNVYMQPKRQTTDPTGVVVTYAFRHMICGYISIQWSTNHVRRKIKLEKSDSDTESAQILPKKDDRNTLQQHVTAYYLPPSISYSEAIGLCGNKREGTLHIVFLPGNILRSFYCCKICAFCLHESLLTTYIFFHNTVFVYLYIQ